MADQQPYFTIHSRRAADANGAGRADGPSATRAFPNRGRSSQRYKKVQALLLHWGSDDLFVLPELEDLEKCLRDDFAFGTDIFAIPSENSHLELMMRVGQLIKEYESQDTLFLIYYGGHARIDESRQSTWCATRDPSSPWLQWSAIQTLLERSKSDVLILLDCCAGAASATFPSGNSITETISASSWDAIAPDPGRYSFTNALIEVLQEWRMRTFSAAMLHAEVLARLKHPRPITINGKHFEARSTPVHFMMTANHKAPSIELSRLLPTDKVVEPGASHLATPILTGRAADSGDPISNGLASNEPNEDTPHVMISLALEDDQKLDINAWEQWLNAFPSMAKYVKVQGVFKSHSTLMLVSMPVMVWDLLPEDPAVSFVAFIRSNNLAMQRRQAQQRIAVPSPAHRSQMDVENSDNRSIITGVSGTTFAATENVSFQRHFGETPSSYGASLRDNTAFDTSRVTSSSQSPTPGRPVSSSSSPGNFHRQTLPVASTTSLSTLKRQATAPTQSNNPTISRQMILNQQQSSRRTTFGDNVPEPKKFSAHVEQRLEEYYQEDSLPNDAHSAFIASNLGIELWHLEVWFHHRRERDFISNRLATMELKDVAPDASSGPRMILPADLNSLLQISRPGDALLFDIRSAVEYERSHIYGAIHLRAPKSFLQAAPLDLIERAIPDEQGRKQLSHWDAAKCLVFYGRGLEFSWECPGAEIISQKLRENGWTGQCFILRGHYREFSQSFDEYIVGTKMTQSAKDWVSSQATILTTEGDREMIEARYSSWLDHVESEDQARPLSTSPTRTPERFEASQTQDKDLEAEFKSRHGSLFSKAMDIRLSGMGYDGFDSKAGMVEYLDRGLEKILGVTQQPPTTYAPGHSKLASDDYPERYVGKRVPEQDDDGEYVEVSKSDEPATFTARNERARQNASVTGDNSGGRGGGLLNKMFRR
ncbi:hypothetical protein QQS21_009772 [Conoideocrella luteorostrata]|uniref:Tyrosine-protein phosphatase non-receptor type 6 n=1 Tax=Conoideocrella luteorostrata TaxID=1105319 RepID=A0AAJ0FQ22_9HYPO|nr:hypothetical protein QQS21_009772 [Conoideocrella luteorostrata]